LQAIIRRHHAQIKACPTKRAVDGGDSAAFDKHFSGFEFFLLSGIVPARPSATNANRWLLALKSKAE